MDLAVVESAEPFAAPEAALVETEDTLDDSEEALDDSVGHNEPPVMMNVDMSAVKKNTYYTVTRLQVQGTAIPKAEAVEAIMFKGCPMNKSLKAVDGRTGAVEKDKFATHKVFQCGCSKSIDSCARIRVGASKEALEKGKETGSTWWCVQIINNPDRSKHDTPDGKGFPLFFPDAMASQE